MNTSKYNWILYFVTTTIIITIAVQFYWNYKNFQLNKQRVSNEIQLSLDNALEEYYTNLAKTDFLTIIETNDTSASSSFDIRKIEINTHSDDHEHVSEKVDSILVNVQNELKKNDSIRGVTQWSESGDGYTLMRHNTAKAVKVLKGKKASDSLKLIKSLKPIFISLQRDSLEYGKIDSLFKKQLDKKNITISYWLNHEKEDTLYHTTKTTLEKETPLLVSSKSTFLKPNERFNMAYISPFKEALKRSSLGILLSFLLAAAIVSCLFYLLKIIKHQKQLAEVKNDLISNITHEFKTPIATIGVALESMKNFKVLDDKKKTESYLDMSSEQLSKLNVMVEKLLETASLDSENLNLNKEETNINTLLNTVFTKHQLQNEEKTMYFNYSDEMIIGNVDVFHFENAINNLIDNAIKYGGDRITLNLIKDNNAILISVTDNGNTLSKISKERIFEKFYRVPKGNTHDVKGFGIGLYYAKKIIEKHGGTILLDLKNGLTTFNMSIPNE